MDMNHIVELNLSELCGTYLSNSRYMGNEIGNEALYFLHLTELSKVDVAQQVCDVLIGLHVIYPRHDEKKKLWANITTA